VKPPVANIEKAILTRVGSNATLPTAGVQLPKLQLRQPGETHRESVAMAKILAVPSRSDRSDRSQGISPMGGSGTDRVSNPQDADSRPVTSANGGSSRIQLKGVTMLVPRETMGSNVEVPLSR
jgi:hypothetical protein